MSNPLIFEEPFWNRERLLSGVLTSAGIVLVAVTAGGEDALKLALAAVAHLACLWAPYVVAQFPLAGAMFMHRPLSHESSEASVLIMGWIFLVCWSLGALYVIGASLWPEMA
jgi:hypothetical protein